MKPLWIKWYPSLWLHSTARDEMTASQRATFHDFVCLAAISAFPGQFKFSTEEGLARMLNTAIEEVRSTIKVCVERKRISVKKDKEGYILKISKWHIYQALKPVDNNDAPDDFKVNNKSHESYLILSKSSSFLEWWKQYPKKVEQKDAIKAYGQAIKAGATEEQLLTSLRAYCAKLMRDKTEEKYIKNPATFLRSDRWKDYLSAPAEKPLQVGETRERTRSDAYWAEVRRLKGLGLEGKELERSLTDWIAYQQPREEKP